MMYAGEQVFRVRIESVENFTCDEENNRWIFDRKEDDGTLVMKNIYIEDSLCIPTSVFEACMEPYIIGRKSDEEDIF